METLQKFDELDKKILEELQRGGRTNVLGLAKKWKIPQATLYLRIKRLEKRGVIKGYTALLDRQAVGLDVTAVVEVVASTQANWDELNKRMAENPNVQALYSVTGNVDGVAVVVARNMRELNDTIMKIRGIPGIMATRTKAVLKVVKESGALPIA
jgi:Lrp/AsnC family transcriptional regulator for asnA, asnC and gidA